MLSSLFAPASALLVTLPGRAATAQARGHIKTGLLHAVLGPETRVHQRFVLHQARLLSYLEAQAIAAFYLHLLDLPLLVVWFVAARDPQTGVVHLGNF